MQNFYAVFPELRQVDVRAAPLALGGLWLINRACADLPRRRVLCGAVHPLLW